MKKAIFSTLILFLAASAVKAQDDDRYYYVYNY